MHVGVFLCDKDRLAVLDIFLAGFYLSNKVNFKNCFANKLIKWFVLYISATVSCSKPRDKTLLLVF